MSLTAFKRKSAINQGTKRSGSSPGGIWLSRTNNSKEQQQPVYGPAGFSINGGSRNVGGVGRDMKMSKSGTPYRGVNPVGFGGTYGKYPTTGQVLNARIVDTQGTQHLYIKPSVLSNYGMLAKKMKWVRYGQYPNYWVQPNYTGNLTDNAAQSAYIQTKSTSNTINMDVNNVGTYEGHKVSCCSSRNSSYSKTLYQPISYEQYNLYRTRACTNPVGAQKPFPFAVATGSSQSAAGSSITSFASSCNIGPVYLSPPDWYINSGPQTQPSASPPQTIV